MEIEDGQDAAQRSNGDHTIHKTASNSGAHSHQSDQLSPDDPTAPVHEAALHATSQVHHNSLCFCKAEGSAPFVPGPSHAASAALEASKEAALALQLSGPPESDLSKVNIAASAQTANQPACTPELEMKSTSKMPPEASAKPAGSAKPALAPIFGRAKPKQAKLSHAAHPLRQLTPPSRSSPSAPAGASIKQKVAEAAAEGAQRQGQHAATIGHEMKDDGGMGSRQQSECPAGEEGVHEASGPGDQKSPKAGPIFGVRAGSKAKSQEQHEQAPPNAGGNDLLDDKPDEAAGCGVCPVMLQNTWETAFCMACVNISLFGLQLCSRGRISCEHFGAASCA